MKILKIKSPFDINAFGSLYFRHMYSRLYIKTSDNNKESIDVFLTYPMSNPHTQIIMIQFTTPLIR